MARKPKKSRLSDVDQAIWDHVKKSVTPLPEKGGSRNMALLSKAGSKTKVEPGKDQHLSEAMPEALPQSIPLLGGIGSQVKSQTLPAQSHDVMTNQSQLPHVDTKLKRKLSKGQRTIEARLDLHGMRQDEAYRVLHRFIHRCAAQGLRHVIVITGKGKLDYKREPGADLFAEPVGVLRRRLPQWLADPALKPLVSGVSQAPQHHGGDGAFYVHIRRRKPKT